MTTTAVYPGTFDPITNGHSDLVNRATRMFDKVILAIADHPEKSPLFSLDERISMARAVLGNNRNIEVVGFSGLLIDFAEQVEAKILLRGLRAVSDFEYEFQLASMNRRLNCEIETVFLTPSENHTFVSASLVKEIAKYQGEVGQFVHEHVFEALKAKYQRK